MLLVLGTRLATRLSSTATWDIMGENGRTPTSGQPSLPALLGRAWQIEAYARSLAGSMTAAAKYLQICKKKFHVISQRIFWDLTKCTMNY